MKISRAKVAPYAFAIYFVIYALFIEAVSFISLNIGFLPQYFLLNFSLIVAVGAIIYFLHNRVAQAIIVSLLITAQVLIFFTNHSMFRIFGEIFNIETLFIAADGTEAIEMSFLSITMMVLSISIVALNVLFLILINNKIVVPALKEKKQQQKQPKGKAFLAKLMVFLIIFSSSATVHFFNVLFLKGNENVVYAGSISQQGYTIEAPVLQNNDKLLYEKLYFKVAAYKKFGTYGFYFKQILNFLGGSSSQKEIDQALEYMEGGAKAPKSTVKRENNNFIAILMESLDSFVIDENLTPNLYAMSAGLPIDVGTSQFKSYSMTNYYSKSKTNASECGGNLGTTPYFSIYSNSWENAKKDDLSGALDFSLANKFKAKGYTTNYLINHSLNYYGRDHVFNANVMGFDNTLDGMGLAGDDMMNFWGDWAPDSYLIEKAMDTLVPQGEKFFTWISTMFTHGPYEGKANGLLPYLETINRLEAQGIWTNPMSKSIYASKKDVENFKNYQAAAMDFDLALGKILNRLEELGIENKTTIMLFADHEAYYYNFTKKIMNIKLNTYTNPQIYNVPMFIIDTQFADERNHEIDKFVTFYDVYATILDVANIDYNQNLCFGESVFVNSSEWRVLLSPTGGVFDADIFTLDGLIHENLVYNALNVTSEVKSQFYRAVNLVVYKADMLRHLFDNKLYKQLNNKDGL